MFMLKKTHRAELQPYIDEREAIKAYFPFGTFCAPLSLVEKVKVVIQRNVALNEANRGLRGDVQSAEAAYEECDAELRRLHAELAIWRKYGQLRDPANGRLVPKDSPRNAELFQVARQKERA